MSDGWFSAVNAIFAILSLCLFFIHDHSIILTIDEYGIKYSSKDKEITNGTKASTPNFHF